MENIRVFNCNMELTLDIIGGKWKPIIIYHVGNNEKMRYGELKRLIPSINERVLSRELRELEQKGIVTRDEFKEKVLRVEYSLTDIGNDVLPLLNSLTEWGNKYNQQELEVFSLICINMTIRIFNTGQTNKYI
ncbi:MAG: helix-turn-helix domain-containing protein [Eubacteriales bacterium]